jgi:hypothetical protein
MNDKEFFFNQAVGKSRREFPQGRISADDDGALGIAIAFDERHQRIVLQFAEPTSWIGLDKNSAEQIIFALQQKIAEMK